MMGTIFNNIANAKREGKKLLAILLDPEKVAIDEVKLLASKIKSSVATHVFVGGSTVLSDIAPLVTELRKHVSLPLVLFPGSPSQITDTADGILLLSLISGRNPDFLIGHHKDSAMRLKASGLEVIPTGYILIGSGNNTAVAKVSNTTPIDDINEIRDTAIAAELLGHKLIYLEAGSGANFPVPLSVISEVARNISVPLIVGGGIRTKHGIDSAFAAGANMVVIGTAFEEDLGFFDSY